MKIRIKGNSIRIRIVKTELANFGKDGILEERTEFAGNHLTYRLQSKEGIDKLEASMGGNVITMWVPEKMREEWVNTGIVGYSNNMDIGEGKELFLLMEKER
jgi:hypothetical protein